MKMNDAFEEFVNKFDLVDNALDMRNLMRWNGRDLRHRENLSEHTHLVVVCALKIMSELKDYGMTFNIAKIIFACLVHDSTELLRGDILSITKDAMDGLREAIDKEEDVFMTEIVGYLTKTEKEVIRLADLMACYKFLEKELAYPNNDFAKDAYLVTRNKFLSAKRQFVIEHDLYEWENGKKFDGNVFVKGYDGDAGIDILLQESVTFMPQSTTKFGLKIQCNPSEREMSFLCARTSAAAKGLCVATCPIDPNFTGEVTAIVHNISNNIITYNAGESFCQLVTVPFNESLKVYDVKKPGKRSDGKLGSTDL